MFACLFVKVLSRESQIVTELFPAPVRAFVGYGSAEGIAVPAPDFVIAFIGDNPRRTEVIAVDGVDPAVFHRGDGEVTEPDGLLYRFAFSVVFTQQAVFVVGEVAFAVAVAMLFTVMTVFAFVMFAVSLLFPLDAGGAFAPVGDAMVVSFPAVVVAVVTAVFVQGHFLDTLAEGVVAVLGGVAVVDGYETVTGIVLIAMIAVVDQVAVGVIAVVAGIDGGEAVAGRVDGVAGELAAVVLAQAVAVGVVFPGQTVDVIIIGGGEAV